ncbi:MAG: zf-HC2 domain-containing protein [Chloroflexi bacterium]|nr:zf-HC2 domain-containing protein [Chloroflexota bacterium]
MTNPHGDNALDCAHARDLIDAFLLDELEPTDAARLAAHVKSCAACAAEIGGSTRVLGLLGTLSTPRPMPDLDERILVAAFEDRRRRHEHRSWLSDLRTQVIRGAMRTTGTLVVTIMTVALLGGAFVFAASQFVTQLQPFQPVQHATVPPVATPTLTPVSAVPTAPPGSATATPRPSSGPSATPQTEPTTAPTATPEPSATPELSASPSPSVEPSASPTPSVEPTPTPTAEPTPTPTPSPSPTDKRRTPPPSISPLP